jgi:hypothetical protein
MHPRKGMHVIPSEARDPKLERRERVWDPSPRSLP